MVTSLPRGRPNNVETDANAISNRRRRSSTTIDGRNPRSAAFDLNANIRGKPQRNGN